MLTPIARVLKIALKPSLAAALLLACSQGYAAESEPARSFNEVYKDYQSAAQGDDTALTVHLAREAAALGKVRFGDHAQNTANLMYNLANALNVDGQTERAAKVMAQVLPLYEKHYSQQSHAYFSALADEIQMSARVFKSERRAHERELRSRIDTLTGIADSLLTQPDADKIAIHYTLARVFNQGMLFELMPKTAQEYTQKAEQLLSEHFGERDMKTIEMRYILANIDIAKKRFHAAEERFEQVLSALEPNLDFTHPYALSAHMGMVIALEEQGKRKAATRHCRAIGEMTPWTDNIEPTPLFRTPPKYPLRYIRKSRDGWVRMSFDIDTMGFPVNIKVIESKGGDLFTEAATEALEEWRYAPKFENGEAVVAQNLKVQLAFKTE